MEFTPDLPEVTDYLTLFVNDTPLLDVRSPIEFADGTLPTAQNYPLLNNEERHAIGLTYKKSGKEAAIQLGLQLVTGDKKQTRVTQWQDFAKTHPQGVLYCFRGGLRSKISQQWLYENSGISYPRVAGGYKHLRLFLSEQLAKDAAIMRPVILAGATGVGKTELLKTVNPHINLEALAKHRGSAFGRYAQEQPTQGNFENALAHALIKIVHHGNPHYLVEDESSNIGARRIPSIYFQHLNQAPVVVLEVSLEERIALTLQEYVHNTLHEYQNQLNDKEQGFATWTHYLFNSLERIQKRLGGALYETIAMSMQKAIHHHRVSGSSKLHEDWIRLLLVNYYDRMYQYQLTQKSDRIVFTGSQKAVLDYLQTEYKEFA